MVAMPGIQRPVIHDLLHDRTHLVPVVPAGALDALLVLLELSCLLQRPWHRSGAQSSSRPTSLTLPSLAALIAGRVVALGRGKSMGRPPFSTTLRRNRRRSEEHTSELQS